MPTKREASRPKTSESMLKKNWKSICLLAFVLGVPAVAWAANAGCDDCCDKCKDCDDCDDCDCPCC